MIIPILLSKIAGGNFPFAFKVVFPLATFLSNFIIDKLLTGQTGLALLLSIAVTSVSTVIVAWIANRPKHIAAISAADSARHGASQSQFGLLLERMQIHHTEVVSFMLERQTRLNKLVSILTIMKHRMAGQVNGQQRHLELRGELLRDASVDFPKCELPDLAVLFDLEDKMRAELDGIELPESFLKL